MTKQPNTMGTRSGVIRRQDSSSSVMSATTASSSIGATNSMGTSSSIGEEAIVDRMRRYGIKKMEKNRTVGKEKIFSAPLHVRSQVEEVHRWLFVEGGHFEDIQSLMTEYCMYVRDRLRIPLDRLFFGGIGLHPKLTGYVWKWELDSFEHREMPPEIFARRKELFSSDEPFCVLEQGRVDFVRIRSSDKYIPPDTKKWFKGGNYEDYFALPDIHRGENKGGLAWSTKHKNGFTDEHIEFFELTQPALSTVMRLHTNDLVLKTLTERMENEIEERTYQLEMANDELEKANGKIERHAAKQLEHFACMSHEIRTPLNCIVGLSSLMMETIEEMTPENEESIRMIHENGNLLKCVVDDVLDYAKLESGCFMVNIQPCNLNTTISSVVKSIDQKAKKRGVMVRPHYSAELSDAMETDCRRLQQVLYNLLGNAEKFSKSGGVIDFSVSMEDYDDWQKHFEGNDRIYTFGDKFDNSENLKVVKFSVKDYGKGINQEDFGKIFEPFSQASKETQSVYGGTGLGLSITSKLVKRLGGFISLDSEPEKFTDFCVHFPFRGTEVDVADLKEQFANTTVAIIGKKLGNPVLVTGSHKDESVSLSMDVARTFDLGMLRCPDWEDLEMKLSKSANLRKNMAIIVDSSDIDCSKYSEVESQFGRSCCALFTCGRSNLTLGGVHLGYMATKFPASTLKKISSHMRGKREKENLKTIPGVVEFDSVPTDIVIKKEPHLEIQSLRILYADDNKINRKVLDRMLRSLGITDIDLVDDGSKAVDFARSKSYDVIFLDMEMPVMGGLEACKLITQFDSVADVVFCTGHSFDEYRKRAEDAGAKDYVTKPFDIKMIESVLQKSANLEIIHDEIQNEREEEKQNESKEEERDQTPIIRFDKQKALSLPTGIKFLSTIKPRVSDLNVLYAEDNLINQKVLHKVLQRIGVGCVDLVDNGQKAIEIVREKRYDIIFMDIQMPVMDGLEASKQILEADPSAVIIVITAHALDHFRENAAFTGCADFVAKPVNLKKIQSVLQPYTIFEEEI